MLWVDVLRFLQVRPDRRARLELPAQPGMPARAGIPAQPDALVRAAGWAQPEIPEQPDTRAQPELPDTRAQPVVQVQPAIPAQPDIPAKRDTRAQPVILAQKVLQAAPSWSCRLSKGCRGRASSRVWNDSGSIARPFLCAPALGRALNRQDGIAGAIGMQSRTGFGCGARSRSRR